MLGFPGTTITAVEYPTDLTATIKLSADATAGGNGVVLTAGLPYDASAETVEAALRNLPGVPYESMYVEGLTGGPYTVYFGVELENQNPLVGKEVPQITADGSGLTPSGGVSVATVLKGGEGYGTHYHFEYVSQKQFETPGGEGGFAKAASTPVEDIGFGDTAVYVGADLPALAPGESYRFRVVATNTSPGDPVVDGEEQSVTVPVSPTVPAAEGACPNESLRTGPSARLPDCRAYEQVTPVDKEGAQEIFNYGGGISTAFAVGEDGDHFMFDRRNVKYGGEPDPGQSPYVFARTGAGWRMTAATAQPEAGVLDYTAQVFSPNLTQFAFEAGFETSPGVASTRSSDIQFRAGPVGGPYGIVASVPRAQAEPGWVAASADFSKLVLEVEDHGLLGHSTHTQEGADLYEYSEGELGQVNVTGPAPGSTIGVCGAQIVRGVSAGLEDSVESIDSTQGSHAVSADGSRVFFEAVPSGEGCSEARHLYVRVNGAETLDLGAYTFVAANKDGSEAVLQKRSGENPGLYLYKAGAATPEFLPSSGIAAGLEVSASQGQIIVSEDLSTVYIITGGVNGAGGAVYRYDVPARTLGFVTQITQSVDVPRGDASSAEGRYFYFDAETVAGFPAAGRCS